MANINPTEHPTEEQDLLDAQRELDEAKARKLVREQNDEYKSDDKPMAGWPSKPEQSDSVKKAFDYLEKLLLNEEVTNADRMRAAQIILDHSHL